MDKVNEVKPDRIFTVSEITELIKQELKTAFPMLWVEGEISDFSRAHSGHLYFTMKDAACQLRAVMFRSEAQRIAFEMKDGLQVVCRGRIDVYKPQGKYQIIIEVVEPKGKGALQLAFEQLKEKLEKEGLFDPRFKKKLPLLPKKVGVVTSSKGAAIIDILKTLERRFARLHILIYPVKVQGEGAADEIVEGIDYFSQRPDVDVIIVGRGGGSIEDLWAFNEEKVARAIFHCAVPVISAVGHEIDLTISDIVADIRASTPTAAAEAVIEKEASFEERIENLEKSIIHQQKYILQEYVRRVSNLTRHYAFQIFKDNLRSLGQKVDGLETKAWNSIRSRQQRLTETRSRVLLMEEKISNSLRTILQSFYGKWETFSAQLHSLSPLNILKKGYTLCWKNGKRHLVRQIEEVEKETEMTVSFYKGEFTCLVKKVDSDRSIDTYFTKKQRVQEKK